MSGTRNHYEVLGVQKDADADTIKSAFKKLAAKHHPDTNPGDPKAADRFKEISLAYQVLSDPTKRQMYDGFGAKAPVDLGPGFNIHVQDMMDELFKGTDFYPFGMPRRNPSTQDVRKKLVPGDDITVDLQISLEESIAGCRKPVTVKGPRPNVACSTCSGMGSPPGTRRTPCIVCAGYGKVIADNGRGVKDCNSCNGVGSRPLHRCVDCSGSGRVTYTKEIIITVPAGVSKGQQLRIAGQGTPGHPPGNLYIEIKVSAGKNFWREENDLHTSKRVSLRHAILGGPMHFAGPNGEELNLQVPPGTQPGDLVKVSGKGIKGALSKESGDLIVHIEVMLPRAVNARARKLLDELMEELARGPNG